MLSILNSIWMVGAPVNSFAGTPGPHHPNAVPANDTLQTIRTERHHRTADPSTQSVKKGLVCCARLRLLNPGNGSVIDQTFNAYVPVNERVKAYRNWQRGNAIANPSLNLKGWRVSGGLK